MRMNIALVGLCICAFTLPLQAQTEVERVVIPALKNVDIKRHYTSREDFKVYARDYDLSNRKTLRLSRHQGKMYAQVGSQAVHEIVRTGNGSFVALDRTMHMQLNVDNFGDINGSMTYIDEDLQKTAALPSQPVIIAVAMQ